MPEKLTYEFVRKNFEEAGYKLDSKKYINAYSKLEFICPKGHKHSICWHDWKKGARCYYCSGKVQYSLEQVKASFEKENYTLLTDEYVNTKTKLNYICPHGHRGSIIFDAWSRGDRCFKCKYVFKMSGANNPNWKGGISCEPYCLDWTKEFKEFIKERDGYKCLNPYCGDSNGVLAVHHIDYNKKNCNQNNLITVCRVCNSKANKDREWHKSWYKAIIKSRYSLRGD